MLAVPADTPVTTPVDASTVATAVLELFQVPPVAVSASVVVEPVQTAVVPVIVPTDGIGLMVTVAEEIDVPQLLVTE